MKCIKHKETGEIERTDNEEARRAIADGNWQYCPKHEWKEQQRRRGYK